MQTGRDGLREAVRENSARFATRAARRSSLPLAEFRGLHK